MRDKKCKFDFNDHEDDDSDYYGTTSNQSSYNPQPSLGEANKRKRTQSTMKAATLQPELEEPSSGSEEEELLRLVHTHITNFFYEAGIPPSVANDRSFRDMIDAIAAAGPGLKPPSIDDLRGPLLQCELEEIDKWKYRHVQAWKKYGCTLMVDEWTTEENQHLITFLVNCREGTFFLESVDASSHVHDETLLADLLQRVITEKIGQQYVVQVVTKDVDNYKAAGKLLEERIPTLYWTPCAAHCLYLMLEDIAKLPDFADTIQKGRYVTTFIYSHERLMNETIEEIGGGDLVKPGATRYATAFLTLQSMYKHKHTLRRLFVLGNWCGSKLLSTRACKRVSDIVLSSGFWDVVEDLIRISTPLLVLLKKVVGNEKPAMWELPMAMDVVEKKICLHFVKKPELLGKLMEIINGRWKDQREVKLQGAALLLNPSMYLEYRLGDKTYSLTPRAVFNDVLDKMVADVDLRCKILDQVDDYVNMKGSFGEPEASDSELNPFDWWCKFGCLHPELQSVAFRILSLCCSSFGCEYNWSTFESLHLEKRNSLEQKLLSDVAYVRYNRKIVGRYEEGSHFNPLILEDFPWDNEWVCNAIVESTLIDEDARSEFFKQFPNDDEDVEDDDDDDDTTDWWFEVFDT